MKPAVSPARQLLIAAAMFAAGWGAPVLAQPTPTPPTSEKTKPSPAAQPELEPFEGRLIRTITFRRPQVIKAGEKPIPGGKLDEATESLARNQLRLKEGSPFNAAQVSEDVSHLNRLGRFSRVESHVQGLSDGTVEVVYTVEPQPLVAAVQTVGNRVFSDQDLVGDGEGLVGTPIDPTRIDRTARRIEQQYQSKGYYNALVSVDQKEMEQNGIILYQVREGERTKVSVVLFEGAFSVPAEELHNAIKTQESNIFSRHPVDDDLLAQDVGALIAFYRDRGHLDVRVGYTIRRSPDNKEAIIAFGIDEGPVFTLRTLRMQMAVPDEVPVFTNEQLLGLMSTQPGDVYSEARIKQSVEAVRTAYGKLGYTDLEVIAYPSRVSESPVVDVVVGVKQGRAFRAGEIVIIHNDITRNDVIIRPIPLKPDRPLDTTEIAEAQKKLTQTNLFGRGGVKLTIQPESPETPGYKDVLVEVEESNTGKFSFGGSLGSDGGLVGLISLQQRNWDMSDTPDSLGEFFHSRAFRGGGQTFTVSAMPGTVSNQLAVSLSDPYVFDTNYSGSAGVYFTTRTYSSYDEERVGARVSVGKHFGSRWNLTVPLRVEQVSLSKIDADAPNDYFEAEDTRMLSTTGFALSRTSLDQVSLPTKGNRIQVGIDETFGESNFTKLSFDYDTYLRLSADVLNRSTVLKLGTSIKYIPQDMSDVPFYERFYLGGQNFRGFGFRGVGPVGIRHDNQQLGSDPIGGKFSFFAGAEVRQPLYEDVLSVVAFMDTGTVDTEFAFDKYRVSVGTGLRILVPQLSQVPLAFDFGFPLLKQDTDNTRIFTFSIDVPFR